MIWLPGSFIKYLMNVPVWNAGIKFKTIKAHRKVQGTLNEGVEVVLDSIAHFPTRYRLKDDEGRIWTVPIHLVTPIAE